MQLLSNFQQMYFSTFASAMHEHRSANQHFLYHKPYVYVQLLTRIHTQGWLLGYKAEEMIIIIIMHIKVREYGGIPVHPHNSHTEMTVQWVPFVGANFHVSFSLEIMFVVQRQ